MNAPTAGEAVAVEAVAGEAEKSEGAATVKPDQPAVAEGEDRDKYHDAREASSEWHSKKCVYAAACNDPQEEEKDRQRRPGVGLCSGAVGARAREERRGASDWQGQSRRNSPSSSAPRGASLAGGRKGQALRDTGTCG